MTFGNPFGLALYDKQQRQVSTAHGRVDGPQQPAGQRPPASRPAPGGPAPMTAASVQCRTQATASTPLPSAPTEASQVALDAETIQVLHNTLRSLPRPLLEKLTQAFRKRFQVPDIAVTIADRICQKSHHDWIEAFLVSHREVRSKEQHQAGTN